MKNAPSPSLITSWMSIIIGLLFVVGGALRGMSIQACTRPGTERWFLLGIVLLQLIAGIVLISGFHRKAAAFVSLALPAVQLWILTLERAAGNTLCDSWRIVGFAVSRTTELVVTLLVLNGLAVIAFLLAPPSSPQRRIGRMVLAFGFCCILYGEYLIVSPLMAVSAVDTFIKEHRYLDYAVTRSPAFDRPQNRLLFVMSFHDFNCPPCLEGFLYMAETAPAQVLHDPSLRTLAMFMEDDVAHRDDPGVLLQWAASNHVRIPLLVAPDTLFTNNDFEKSFLLFVDENGHIVSKHMFPIEQSIMTSAVAFVNMRE